MTFFALPKCRGRVTFAEADSLTRSASDSPSSELVPAWSRSRREIPSQRRFVDPRILSIGREPRMKGAEEAGGRGVQCKDSSGFEMQCKLSAREPPWPPGGVRAVGADRTAIDA